MRQWDGVRSVVKPNVLPVLGIVSLIPNEARQKQERTSLIRFLLAAAALLVTYAGGIAVLTYLSYSAA